METTVLPNKDDEVSENTISLKDLRLPAYIPIGLCLLLLGWLYWPTFDWWYSEWNKKESYYSHGILIPPITLFLIWMQRQRLKSIPLRPDALGFPIILLTLICSFVALLASAQTMIGLPFPIVLIGVVMVIFGRPMARQLAFPIGYLYFMCVLPSFIITILSFRIQMISTAFATVMLKAIGFDAYREGAMIIMPNLPVYVGAACSGFKMTITLIAITTLFLYVTEGPRWGRAVLFFSTIPLAVFVNSIRIALVSIVGEYSGSEPMQFFHDNVAPYIEIVMAFALLLLIGRLVKCLKFNSILTS